jgi:hypothetical protein
VTFVLRDHDDKDDNGVTTTFDLGDDNVSPGALSPEVEAIDAERQWLKRAYNVIRYGCLQSCPYFWHLQQDIEEARSLRTGGAKTDSACDPYAAAVGALLAVCAKVRSAITGFPGCPVDGCTVGEQLKGLLPL